MILWITAPNGFASASFDNSNCKITSAPFTYFYRQLEFYSLKTRNGLSKTKNRQTNKLEM